MVTRFMVYPYAQKSHSAKVLAEALDGQRILRIGSKYKYRSNDLIINWGCGECPYPQALNADIMSLINKKKFFARLKGTGLTPDFATTKEAAKTLGYPVFCRTTIEGRDGQGIVVADCDGQLVNAPLYVKGIDKTSEYRIHIGRYADKSVVVLGGAKKHKNPITPQMVNVPNDSRVWCGETTSFGNFELEGSFPAPVQEVVRAVFSQFPELTFAAFDVVYDNSEAKAYVIEGNSAPMSTPQTTKAYADFFRKYALQVQVQEQAPVPSAPLPASQSETAPLTFESVVSDLNREKISLKKIIEGYIQHVQIS